MKRTLKLMTCPLLACLAMTTGLAAAQPGAMEKTMRQEQSAAGEQLPNLGEEEQLRHRVNENDPDKAKKVRQMEEEQKGKKSQHQHRYEEKSPGQHMQRSGSGMGGGGGGRR
jgi:hypothetical protein